MPIDLPQLGRKLIKDHIFNYGHFYYEYERFYSVIKNLNYDKLDLYTLLNTRAYLPNDEDSRDPDAIIYMMSENCVML